MKLNAKRDIFPSEQSRKAAVYPVNVTPGEYRGHTGAEGKTGESNYKLFKLHQSSATLDSRPGGAYLAITFWIGCYSHLQW